MSTPTLIARHAPESPFLSDVPAADGEDASAAAYAHFTYESPFAAHESPFPSRYGPPGGASEGADPAARLAATIAAELHDPEFGDAVAKFAQEAYEAVLREADLRGRANSGVWELEAVADDRFAADVRELEQALDRMAAESGALEVAALSETAVEELFARHAPASRADPEFEYFVQKLWDKAKKAVGTVAKVAGKAVQQGLKVAGKLLPLGKILGVLRKLVGPLVRRVLRLAIDKLPSSVRPAARQLAAKLAGKGDAATATATATAPANGADPAAASGDAAPDAVEQTPAAPDPQAVTAEFDYLIAAGVVGEDDRLAELEFEAPADPSVPAMTVRELDQARQALAEAAVSLPPGASLAPKVEQFIPAVLAAAPAVMAVARTGIRLLGREKVVKAVAGLVSKLIQPHVGTAAAGPLATAIASTGMGLLKLETSADAARTAAGLAIASTVEGTVRRLGEAVERYALDGRDLESPVLLEALTLEAFEQAAAANFPPQLVRGELREAPNGTGMWVLLPQSGTRYYKKHTLVHDVTVDPATADAVKTFGGTTLADFLFRATGLPRAAVRARIHLYEAIPGTWLSRISLYERNVPGLGSAKESAWGRLHPLTTAAATALLRLPSMGRDVDARYLASRHAIAVGQRFYYLEIDGAPAPKLPESEPVSQVNVTIDCPGQQVRLSLYTSEAVSQQIAASLRQNAPLASVLRIYAGIVAAVANTVAEGPGRHVKVVHEAESFAPALPALGAVARAAAMFVLRWLGKKLVEWVMKQLADYLTRKAAEFRAAFLEAADDPAAGVSLVVTLGNPPGLSVLCAILAGRASGVPSLPEGAALPTAEFRLRPGLYRE